jgi:glutathione S-transferase
LIAIVMRGVTRASIHLARMVRDCRVRPGSDVYGEETAMKIWGRKTSANVQKAMWAVDELGLACERIDIAGPFGKNREPAYLAMNPNGLVPTLEEDDGFLLWESNVIVRYLAGKYGVGTLAPADPKQRALADQWMDWQTSVVAPAMFGAFWGLIRTPPEKRDHAAIKASQAKSTEAMVILDAQLANTRYVAGDSFSMGDIPVGVMAYRFWEIVPERPPLPHLQRWYAEISARPAFKAQVSSVPLQ